MKNNHILLKKKKKATSRSQSKQYGGRPRKFEGAPMYFFFQNLPYLTHILLYQKLQQQRNASLQDHKYEKQVNLCINHQQ